MAVNCRIEDVPGWNTSYQPRLRPPGDYEYRPHNNRYAYHSLIKVTVVTARSTEDQTKQCQQMQRGQAARAAQQKKR
jgi:hypothetical protein